MQEEIMNVIRQLKFDGFEVCEFLELPGKFPPIPMPIG